MAFSGPQTPIKRASRLILVAMLFCCRTPSPDLRLWLHTALFYLTPLLTPHLIENLVLFLLVLWSRQPAGASDPPRVLKRATPEEVARIKDEIAVVILTSRYAGSERFKAKGQI